MVSYRGASTSSLGASTSQSDSGNKKRSVTYATFQKWCQDFDREIQTLSWLDCNTIFYKDGKKIVTHLKCSICTKFKANIKGRRNYSARWRWGGQSSNKQYSRPYDRSSTHSCLFSTQTSVSSG